MPQLTFAQKAVIVDHDRILLVRKSAADPHNPGLWELPGGRLKTVLEPLDDQITREVREETGFHVVPKPTIVDMWDWQMMVGRASVRVIAVSRLCNVMGEPGKPHRAPGDFLDELAWYPFDQLPRLAVIKSQRPTMERLPDFILALSG
ncbi:NUDIX domain-containing protein [Herbidospora mongoliensis]|uniref:NUDIX domain-containing protein n=1 Tax=Herbidospora mongoliensis TaxID=688067 RepID=UPI00082B5401|nr:NUDIX domain-containing protein [Herbidospora mongoliensis]